MNRSDLFNGRSAWITCQSIKPSDSLYKGRSKSSRSCIEYWGNYGQQTFLHASSNWWRRVESKSNIFCTNSHVQIAILTNYNKLLGMALPMLSSKIVMIRLELTNKIKTFFVACRLTEPLVWHQTLLSSLVSSLRIQNGKKLFWTPYGSRDMICYVHFSELVRASDLKIYVSLKQTTIYVMLQF